MSSRKSVPTYRRHKKSGQAIVTLPDGFGNRKDFYLGPYGSAGSRREYSRLIEEWESCGQRLPAAGEPHKFDLTVNELILAYWKWAQARYVKDGKPTSEQDSIRQAMRFVRKLYGDTRAREFGPLALKAVRAAMIRHKIIRVLKVKDPKTGEVREVEKVLREGLARTHINKQIGRIKAAFKWAVAEELVPAATFQAITCVTGLRRGEAREKAPVGPVDEAAIEATLPHLPPILADAVRVQRLTGARPSEVLGLRAVEINRTGPIWEFRPGRHKTEHYDRERIIFFGPRAQQILRNYLTLEMTAPLFRPDLSEERRNLQKRQARRTPLTPSAKIRRAGQYPRGVVGQQYDVASYRRAITRACEKAGVLAWTPHQLRHTAATEVRKRFGLEAAQCVLGHAELGVTQVYAERDMETARRVMAEIG
jgi:integrase